MDTVHTASLSDPTRRKIEALGPRLSLPLVRRAMGIVEGEHHSRRRGSGYEFMDLRPYVIGDESRSIDWKATARAGEPIVSLKERTSTSNVWVLIDSGRQLTGHTASGERQIDVALNAVRMFTMLSLKRADNVNFIIGNAHSITRMPFTGGYREADSLLDQIAQQPAKYDSNWPALMDYARHIQDKYALIIMATSDTSWTKDTLEHLGVLTQTHPVVVLNVAALNPFEHSEYFSMVRDGVSHRHIPAFLSDESLAQEVTIQRKLTADELTRRLNTKGASLFSAKSSEDMFHEFVHRISLAHVSSSFLQ
ncbi:DUF58 domain-containing protein [Alloscardovia macacae]|nr:DUF58 domain-containing protein [Alloscardovia macacae]